MIDGGGQRMGSVNYTIDSSMGATPTTGNGHLFWLADTHAAAVRFYRVTERVP
jgi:hypothetical protein